MAEESVKPEHEEKKSSKGGEKKGGGMMKKLLIFGVPAFLVQLVLIYFLTAKFVVPMTVQSHVGKVGKHDAGDKSSAHEEEAADEEESGDEAKATHIYVVKDMIINPAGTNGQRYLLATIAFNVSTEKAMKELEVKEIAVRDMLNSILTRRTMEQLTDVAQRESLREEIQSHAKELVSGGKVKSVYFSKYIVQ
jgi:flagellar FliL protein